MARPEFCLVKGSMYDIVGLCVGKNATFRKSVFWRTGIVSILKACERKFGLLSSQNNGI